MEFYTTYAYLPQDDSATALAELRHLSALDATYLQQKAALLNIHEKHETRNVRT